MAAAVRSSASSSLEEVCEECGKKGEELSSLSARNNFALAMKLASLNASIERIRRASPIVRRDPITQQAMSFAKRDLAKLHAIPLGTPDTDPAPACEHKNLLEKIERARQCERENRERQQRQLQQERLLDLAREVPLCDPTLRVDEKMFNFNHLNTIFLRTDLKHKSLVKFKAIVFFLKFGRNDSLVSAGACVVIAAKSCESINFSHALTKQLKKLIHQDRLFAEETFLSTVMFNHLRVPNPFKILVDRLNNEDRISGFPKGALLCHSHLTFISFCVLDLVRQPKWVADNYYRMYQGGYDPFVDALCADVWTRFVAHFQLTFGT